MKILITGGAGFIGSHTVVELIEAGHTPIIVDNFSNSKKFIIDRIEQICNQRPILHEGDCTDQNFLDNIFSKEKNITGVIHFAAFKAVGESIKKPLKYYDNNLNSLIAILSSMKKNSIPNIVFSSSATVYGIPNCLPISEDHPVGNGITNPYGRSKFFIEQIIQDLCKVEKV